MNHGMSKRMLREERTEAVALRTCRRRLMRAWILPAMRSSTSARLPPASCCMPTAMETSLMSALPLRSAMSARPSSSLTP